MIGILAKHIGRYRRDSVLAVFCMLAEVVTDTLTPIVMAHLIDDGISAGNQQLIYHYGILMAICALFGLLFGFGGGRFAARASAGFAANLRFAIYENIQNFSFSNIDKYSTAGLVTRLTTDVTNVQNAYQMLLRMCMRAPAMLIFALCMSFMISPRLSLTFLYACIFLILVLGTIIHFATDKFSRVFLKYDDLNASVQENITGIRTIKSFVREDSEKKRFRRAVDSIYTLFVKAESLVCINFPVMMFTVYTCTLVISWNGAHEIVLGRLTAGELTSLFTYTMNILMSLMMLSMAFVMITMSAASGRRIAEVLMEEPSIREPEHPVFEIPSGSVDFDHVSFSYGKREKPIDWDNKEEIRRRKKAAKAGKTGRDEETGKSEKSEKSERYEKTGKCGSPVDPGTEPHFVLTDIDLHIREGETIGIIGGTGSSKSSLVSLIPRLYDTSRGTVRVGGRDVRDYDLTALRDAVGMVLQKNTLFSGTIYDNLRWGDEGATPEECRAACEIACADEFIRTFPKQYETWIDQGGANLSGGQRQRICIARALLKKPKILILDDSTSAVDTATDARIREAFRERIPKTTKFIISQRISGVRDADRILVLDEGRISGFGTNEELMETNEIYRSIAEMQEQGVGDFDERKEE